MTDAVKFLVLFILLFVTYTHLCLKIIPERASITYINETYFSNASIKIRRIRRGGEYVANAELISKFELGNNISLDVIFYEYLHNEFRRSFVELHYKLCDFIIKDLYVGIIARRAGLDKCPVPLGLISVKNVSFNIDIPSVWPFEKGKGEIMLTDDVAGVIMGKAEIVMTFKQNLATT